MDSTQQCRFPNDSQVEQRNIHQPHGSQYIWLPYELFNFHYHYDWIIIMFHLSSESVFIINEKSATNVVDGIFPRISTNTGKWNLPVSRQFLQQIAVCQLIFICYKTHNWLHIQIIWKLPVQADFSSLSCRSSKAIKKKKMSNKLRYIFLIVKGKNPSITAVLRFVLNVTHLYLHIYSRLPRHRGSCYWGCRITQRHAIAWPRASGVATPATLPRPPRLPIPGTLSHP